MGFRFRMSGGGSRFEGCGGRYEDIVGVYELTWEVGEWSERDLITRRIGVQGVSRVESITGRRRTLD